MLADIDAGSKTPVLVKAVLGWRQRDPAAGLSSLSLHHFSFLINGPSSRCVVDST
jgi:hypothetical protein